MAAGPVTGFGAATVQDTLMYHDTCVTVSVIQGRKCVPLYSKLPRPETTGHMPACQPFRRLRVRSFQLTYNDRQDHISVCWSKAAHLSNQDSQWLRRTLLHQKWQRWSSSSGNSFHHLTDNHNSEILWFIDYNIIYRSSVERLRDVCRSPEFISVQEQPWSWSSRRNLLTIPKRIQRYCWTFHCVCLLIDITRLILIFCGILITTPYEEVRYRGFYHDASTHTIEREHRISI